MSMPNNKYERLRLRAPPAVNTGPNIRVYLFLEKKPIIELHLLQKALKTNNSILTEVHAVR